MEKKQPIIMKTFIYKGLNIKFEAEYIEIAESIMSKNVEDIENGYLIKPFLFALVNRAMVTSKAIETLFDNENYESVLPLLRVVFDCGLQIKAATMADNKEEFYRTYGEAKAQKIKGEHFLRIKEGTIAESLDNDQWTSEALSLYKFLCGYVHFSSCHYSLLSNDTSTLSIGKLILRENQDSVAEIKQCYEDTSKVVISIIRYYMAELWN